LLPFLLGLSLVGIIFINSIGLINITLTSEKFIAFLVAYPFMLIIPAGLTGMMYFYDFTLTKRNLSLDALPKSSAQAGLGVSHWIRYINSFGTIGQLMALELRLIWRNKRPRTIIIMAIIMLAYFGVFIIRLQDSSIIVAFLLISTGMLMINYGQLLFSWESSYFDFLMTRNFTAKTYMISKFVLFFFFNTIALIIVGGFFTFIDMSMVKDLIIWYLINTGFFAYMFIGGTMLGPKPLDINARAMFNYEGINIFQFLVIIPYILVPFAIEAISKLYFGNIWHDIFLIVTGLMGIAFYRRLSGILAGAFSKRKYKILDGFRE
jgi:hypothetical protein